MSYKKQITVNNKTGDKIVREKWQSGNDTSVRTTLHKANGPFGTRFLGDVKVLKDKTYRK